MEQLKKWFGLDKPHNGNQRVFEAAQQNSHEVRERLERIRRADAVMQRQDLKRRPSD